MGNNSANPSHEGSRASSLGPTSDGGEPNTDSEDISDAEKEIRHRLKKIQDRQNGGGGGERGLYSRKTTVCLDCKKRYVGAAALRTHMATVHGVANYVLRPENRLDSGTASHAESPIPPGGTDSPLLEGEGRRRGGGGKRGLNTRCFRCKKTFMHRPGYKNHLKKMHGGVEPPENRDPANLAMPDDRIVCLICIKKFTTVIGLKLHIQRLHLGITAAAENNDDEEEEEENDGQAEENGMVIKEEEDDEEEKVEGDEVVKKETVTVKTENGEGEENPALEGLTSLVAPTPTAPTPGGSGRGGRMMRLEARPLPADLSEEDKRLIKKMFYSMRKHGCQFCPLRFSNKSKLAMHEAVHAKARRPVLCPYCERSYSRRDKLRLHISRQHVGQPIPDDLSPPSSAAATPRRSYMNITASSAENSPAWVWDGPDGVDGMEGSASRSWESFGFRQQPKYRKSEFPILDDGQIQCPECDMTFDMMKLAMRHVRETHCEEKPQKCPICALSYNDKKGLYQHMFRKHPKMSPGFSVSPSPVMGSPTPSPPLSARKNGLDSGAGKEDGYYIQCPKCPKSYSTQGGFWIHKKTYHPELLSANRLRKAVEKYAANNMLPLPGVSGAYPDHPGRPSVGPNGKKFFCEVCMKYYASYTSLYLHRRNLHPLQYPKSAPGQRRRRAQVAADSAAAIAAGSGGGGNVQVLNLGSGLQIKPHGCAKCGAKFSSLKALALHIEAGHPLRPVGPSAASSGAEENGAGGVETLMDCPYCASAYPSRDKLNVHIRRAHVGMETVKIRQRRRRKQQPPLLLQQLRQQQQPAEDNNDSDVILEEEYLKSSSGWAHYEGDSPRKAKYKAKCFMCPQCGKGYVSAQRLKNHIESRHLKTNDPFRDVGPNTDIAVINPATEAGFDLYKVLGVYTTGLRFKCAKFSPAVNAGHDAWVLTEEVNKNVVKRDIIRVVKTMRRINSDSVAQAQYGIGTAELVSLLQAANGGGGRLMAARATSQPSSNSLPVQHLAAGAANGSAVNGVNAADGEDEEEVEEDADDDDEEEEEEEEVGRAENVAREDEEDDDDDDDEGDDDDDDDDDVDDEDDDEDDEDEEDDDDEDEDEGAGGVDGLGSGGQIMVQPVFEDMEPE